MIKKYLSSPQLSCLLLFITTIIYADPTSHQKTIAHLISNDKRANDNSNYYIPNITESDLKQQKIHTDISFYPHNFSIVIRQYPFSFDSIKMTKIFSVVIYDEGPHLALKNWKTCEFAGYTLKRVANTFTYATLPKEDKPSCQINTNRQSIIKHIEDTYPDEAATRWKHSLALNYPNLQHDFTTLSAYRLDFFDKSGTLLKEKSLTIDLVTPTVL